jgi:nucleoside diphosphate kinase
VRGDGLTRGLPGDVIERFFALGFSLEQMHQNLRDLERCVTHWSDRSVVPDEKTTDEAA